MLRRIGFVLLASLVIVTLTAAPGSADVRTIRDKSGDGDNTLDIRKAKFANNKRALKTRVRVGPAPSQRAFLSLVIDVGNPGRTKYQAITYIKKSGDYTRALFKLAHGRAIRVRCRGLRAGWSDGRRLTSGRIKVPQGCVSGVRKARLRAVTNHPKLPGVDRTKWVRLRRG